MSTLKKKRVIIIGCGYAGASVAKELDKHPELLDLTVITKREDFMLHKISGLRAATAEGNWVPRTMVPITRMMTNGKLVHGSVVSIDPLAKTVTLEDGKLLGWDVLVIASGSRNFSPAEPPLKASSKADTAAYYTAMHAALAQTKNCVIVGGGAVGVELAGEIANYGQPGAKLTIVTNASQLIGSQFTVSNHNAIKGLLQANNVEVIYNDQVASERFPQDLANGLPLVFTPNGVTLVSGKHIDCDLLVFAVGSYVNTSFVPLDWLDPKTKEVIVDQETLTVGARQDVFCLGDAAKLGSKVAYFAGGDSPIVARNVLQALVGQAPTHHIKHTEGSMLVPFGPKQGRLLTPWLTLGDWTATIIKSRGLMTKMTWKNYAAADLPQIPPV